MLRWLQRLKAWVHDTFMYFLIGRSIIYNMSWEDPRIDQALFKFTEEDVVLTLTSAGDQVLDYLIAGPRQVIAVDLNPRQNALLELKLAGLKVLPFESFFEIFGASNGRVFREVYPRLRTHLSPASVEFWDEHLHLFDDRFLWSGACGTLVRWAVWVVRHVFRLGSLLDELAVCATLEAQREATERHSARLEFLFWVLHVTQRLWAPFIAVPSSQLDLFRGNIMKTAVSSVLWNTHLAKENYFYFGQLYGHWTRDCCPRYLQPAHFERLKTLVDRVHVHCGYLNEVVAQYPDASISCFSLLDHMDWMDDATVLDGWRVYRQKAAPGARVLWRSFSLDQHIAPLQYLAFDADAVAEVLERCPDRVMMYNTTFFAVVPDEFAVLPRTEYRPEATLRNDLTVLYHCWISPIAGTQHKERLESFYRGQAQSYDAYRHRFLHGRWPMALAMPTPRGGVWVDMGGGTASNLEFFRSSIDNWGHIFVLDLCGPLLDVARQRVELNGWGSRVTLVEGDACDSVALGRAGGLPEEGTVDVVTFSYSLTMIPDWRAALQVAFKLLKPGGHIAVSDFTVTPQHSQVTRRLWPFIFRHDGVHLSEDHILTLRNLFHQRKLKLDAGGFPYVPLLQCPFFHFVGQKPHADAPVPSSPLAGRRGLVASPKTPRTAASAAASASASATATFTAFSELRSRSVPGETATSSTPLVSVGRE